MIYVAAAAVLAILVIVLVRSRVDYYLWRIVRFQRWRLKGVKRPALFLAVGPARQEVSLMEIRDFVVNLQLGTAMDATLSKALDQTAEQFADKGVLGTRLARHVEARLGISPEAVFEGLVQDFDSTHLVDLLTRIQMAASGGVSYDRVLTLTVDEIEEDIRGMLEEEIEKAPTRLSAIMMIGLFMPILVLMLAPLVGSFNF